MAIMFTRLYGTQNPSPLESETNKGVASLKHRLFGNDDYDDGPRRKSPKRQARFYNESLRSQRLMDDEENDSRPRSPIRRPSSTASFFNKCQLDVTRDTSSFNNPVMSRHHHQNPSSPSEHPLATNVKSEFSFNLVLQPHTRHRERSFQLAEGYG